MPTFLEYMSSVSGLLRGVFTERKENNPQNKNAVFFTFFFFFFCLSVFKQNRPNNADCKNN